MPLFQTLKKIFSASVIIISTYLISMVIIFDWLPTVNELSTRIVLFVTLFNVPVRRKVKVLRSATFIGTDLILVPVGLFEA